MIARLLRRGWPVLLALLLLGGYWLLPIAGRVAVWPAGQAQQTWPQIIVRGGPSGPGGALQPGREAVAVVQDVAPWGHVLLTADGRPAQLLQWSQAQRGVWQWEWSVMPKSSAPTLAFYHDCDSGCQLRGRLALGEDSGGAAAGGSAAAALSSAVAPASGRVPTKLGVVFPNPARDWHGRAGWAVDLTYVRSTETYWGIDELAGRVAGYEVQGLRALVRVDLAPGQSIPSEGDRLALSEYLTYLERLARDDRLAHVYGYIIGSGFNTRGANAGNSPASAQWYARLFNGSGEPPSHGDNAVQTLRVANPRARVLVGPVQPWTMEADGGAVPGDSVAPWLDYLRAVVSGINDSAQTKAAAGIPLAAPDGFALQAPGRPGAPELAGSDPAREPQTDLRREAWGGAQAGFRVYQDWLAIINDFPSTRGLPAYITATNTFAPDDGTPPAQNYPRGWLTQALAEVNGQPQLQALCWFMDGPLGDKQWEWFSLARRVGGVLDAAEEFDTLLQAR